MRDIIAAIIGGASVVDVGGVTGSAKSWLLARLTEAFPGRTIAVICPTESSAETLVTDIRLMMPAAATVRLFPDADVSPYVKLSPEPTRWADRIEILYELAHNRPMLVVASICAATRFAPPRAFVANAARAQRLGDTLDRDEFALWLIHHGYVDVGLVEDEGSFAVRGGIIDVWTPTIGDPVRIELDGETVTDMRRFDPATQRSRDQIREVVMLPAGDICFTPEMTRRALENIRQRADDRNIPAPEKRSILEMVRERISFPGIETLGPLFHEGGGTLADYLPPGALIVRDEPLEAHSAHAEHLESIGALARGSASIEMIVEPAELYHPTTSVIEHRPITLVNLTAVEAPPRSEAVVVNVATHTNVGIRQLVKAHRPGEDALSPLIARIDEWRRRQLHIVFVSHTDVQAQRLIDLLRWQGSSLATHGASIATATTGQSLKPSVVVGRLSSGFAWPDEGIVIVTDEEIFGHKTSVRVARKQPIEYFTSFAEIAEGDILVHEHHGIGRYMGLRHLAIEGAEGDYLLLEYLGGDRLYLPVYRMNLVQRYVGAGDTVPALDRLGGMRWSRVTRAVRRSIMAMAKDLLRIHAAREIYPGFRHPPTNSAYEEFCAAFPYDETPDQETAIGDVMRDLDTERPTDRLICGDVGYGKTEVAMRAAFRAAMAGKQVAVLVPTTVLALQHFETFRERFAATPVRIEMLSRFRTQAEQKSVVAETRRGTVDILIGTHRLLSTDMGFKDLGLVIIDEEQRFGVKHKERLKKLRETVDVITLTATPIPRTLHLSLVGIRDVSVISTPPANRQSITTHVVPFDEAIIRHAILTEIGRGGQVFFVHNRVQTMPSMIDRLKRLVPEATMRMAHGQMKERELEDVMIAFLEREFNVLVCTAIIESGLDISSANTIIVNRADTFGLAQLYQIRGRVGRSDVKAVAYLLTPPDTPLSPAATKRLMVLKRFTELGSGFQIANHDLEIRGAGNILGAAQSGHVAQVGFELYTKLLARAIRKLSGKEVAQEIDPEIKLAVEAYLPENYVVDAGARLDIYRRLAMSDDDAGIDVIAGELVDRFGPLPPETVRLIGIMSIKLAAGHLKVRQLTFDGRVFACQLDQTTPIDPDAVARLAAAEPDRYRLAPPDRILMLSGSKADPERIIEDARNFLSVLLSCAKARSSSV